ncbi:HAMP domain-containing protein [candidate division KSB1 bacterium]|nr:HAMP domain-containing protein [candidate division KSB1 bacterium]
MSILSNLSVKTKITFTIIALTLMIGLFIALYFPFRLSRQAFIGLESRGTTISEMLAYNVSAALEFEDSQAIQEAIASTKTIDEISFMMIYQADGTLVSMFAKDSSRSSYGFQLVNSTQLVTGENNLQVITPIISHGKIIGVLTVGLTLEKLKAEVLTNRLMTLVVTLVVLLICILLGRFISKRLTAPLERLSEAARMVSQGNLDCQVEIESEDEIGILSKTFNEMADSLKKSIQRIEEYNWTL